MKEKLKPQSVAVTLETLPYRPKPAELCPKMKINTNNPVLTVRPRATGKLVPLAKLIFLLPALSANM